METETGLDFLSRVKSKPDLSKLDHRLFKDCTFSPIVEVSGNPNVGKSLLCLHLTASAILPSQWMGTSLGGSGLSVVYIDTDKHFNILHFANLLERRVKNACYKARELLKKREVENDDERFLLTVSKKEFGNKVLKLVEESLDRVKILRCSDSSQFSVTMNTLDYIIQDNMDISLVIVDSISSFYWFDKVYRCEDWRRTEVYYSKLLTRFGNIVKKNRVTAIVTRQPLFGKQLSEDTSRKCLNDCNGYEYFGKDWASIVDIRMILSVEGTYFGEESGSCSHNLSTKMTDRFLIKISEGRNRREVLCTFQEDGLSWLD